MFVIDNIHDLVDLVERMEKSNSPPFPVHHMSIQKPACPGGLSLSRVKARVNIGLAHNADPPMGTSLPYALSAQPNPCHDQFLERGRTGGGARTQPSPQHSVPSSIYQNDKPCVVLYSRLMPSKEEMSTLRNSPVDVLQFANPNVILSNTTAKIIVSHHRCFMLKITLEMIFFPLHVSLYTLNFLLTCKV